MASNRITARQSFHRIWIAGKKSLVKRATGCFPFNHIEDDDLFIAVINQIEICPQIINKPEEMLLNSFEVNED